MAKRRSRPDRVAAAGVALASLLSPTAPGVAQQSDARTPLLTLDVDQRLEWQDITGPVAANETEGLRSVTSLGFGFLSETNSQSLSLQLSGGLVHDFDGADSGTDVRNPLLRFGYSIENRDNALRFNASYRRTNVDDAVFLLDTDLDGNVDLINDPNAILETLSYRTAVELGRDSPISLNLRHAYTESSYSETLNPNLSDRTQQSVAADLGLRLSPVASLSLGVDWSEQDTDSVTGTNRTQTRLSFGGRYDINPVLTATGRLFYSENESETGGVRSETSGLGFSFGLARELRNGALSLNMGSSETINGRRSQFSIGRQIEMQRGDVSASVGVTQSEGFDPQILANVNLTYTPSEVSSIRLAVSQSGTVNFNDQEIISSRVALDYVRELNSFSSFTAGLQLANQDVLATNGNDQTSFRANLTYRHDVGQDWDLVSGISFRSIRSANTADRDTSTVFVGLSKRFEFLP